MNHKPENLICYLCPMFAIRFLAYFLNPDVNVLYSSRVENIFLNDLIRGLLIHCRLQSWSKGCSSLAKWLWGSSSPSGKHHAVTKRHSIDQMPFTFGTKSRKSSFAIQAVAYGERTRRQIFNTAAIQFKRNHTCEVFRTFWRH